jgi:hypothetical protein
MVQTSRLRTNTGTTIYGRAPLSDKAEYGDGASDRQHPVLWHRQQDGR